MSSLHLRPAGLAPDNLPLYANQESQEAVFRQDRGPRRLNNPDVGYFGKTTYVEPVAQVKVRNNPTFQSQLFMQHSYHTVKPEGHRSITPQPGNQSKTARAPPAHIEREPLHATKTGRENFHLPAGLVASKSQTRRDPNATLQGPDIHQPKWAGKNTVKGGEIINVARLDHVEEVIKVDKPALPIKDAHTTYNMTHQRPGFPAHYPPEPKKQPLTKIEAPAEVYPANKRHPYGVKKEPLYEKSKTMLTLKVPENLEPDQLKSELAKKGYHVVKSYFEHNTITNERTGNGFVQLRAANPRYEQEIEKEVKEIGLKFSKKEGALPNQNLVSPKK